MSHYSLSTKIGYSGVIKVIIFSRVNSQVKFHSGFFGGFYFEKDFVVAFSVRSFADLCSIILAHLPLTA